MNKFIMKLFIWNPKWQDIWIQRKLFNRIVENLNLTHLEAQICPKMLASGAYLLHAYKSSCNELIHQVSCESTGNFHDNWQKPIYWPILALFGTKNSPKIWPTGAIFHKYLKIPTMCLFYGLILKIFFRKMAKNFIWVLTWLGAVINNICVREHFCGGEYY